MRCAGCDTLCIHLVGPVQVSCYVPCSSRSPVWWGVTVLWPAQAAGCSSTPTREPGIACSASSMRTKWAECRQQRQLLAHFARKQAIYGTIDRSRCAMEPVVWPQVTKYSLAEPRSLLAQKACMDSKVQPQGCAPEGEGAASTGSRPLSRRHGLTLKPCLVSEHKCKILFPHESHATQPTSPARTRG